MAQSCVDLMLVSTMAVWVAKVPSGDVKSSVASKFHVPIKPRVMFCIELQFGWRDQQFGKVQHNIISDFFSCETMERLMRGIIRQKGALTMNSHGR